MLKTGLTDLNIFDSTVFKHPVTLLNEQLDPSKKVPLNTIGVSSEDIDVNDGELGSNLGLYDWEMYVDIFAESESAGVHLMGDVLGIVRGSLASIGRTSPILPVLDFQQPGNPEIFYCDIENVDSGRVRSDDKTFNNYWWSVGCTIRDVHYGD